MMVLVSRDSFVAIYGGLGLQLMRALANGLSAELQFEHAVSAFVVALSDQDTWRAP